mmetsp:Transcript_31873/g.45324  ORF Transcript_31873/g.45324 Transcript_31873/m.45324 type:complete len:282 (+) Transcript_31873:11-856(+)
MLNNNTHCKENWDEESCLHNTQQFNFEAYIDLMKADIIELDEKTCDTSPPQSFYDDRYHGTIDHYDTLISVIPVLEGFQNEQQEADFHVYTTTSYSSLVSSQASTDTIMESDVLCGRGAGANNHPGNVSFRSMITKYHQAYVSARAIDKANIAKLIVSQVKNSGGRFIKRSSTKDCASYSSPRPVSWVPLSDKATHEKVCQALRERGQIENDIPRTDGASLPIIDDLLETEEPKISFKSKIVVRDEDVLFGRGGVTNSHVRIRNHIPTVPVIIQQTGTETK